MSETGIPTTAKHSSQTRSQHAACTRSKSSLRPAILSENMFENHMQTLNLSINFLSIVPNTLSSYSKQGILSKPTILLYCLGLISPGIKMNFHDAITSGAIRLRAVVFIRFIRLLYPIAWKHGLSGLTVYVHITLYSHDYKCSQMHLRYKHLGWYTQMHLNATWKCYMNYFKMFVSA